MTIISAIILAVVCLHFINLPQAHYYTDEALTIFASRGIIKHGIPVFPTGFFYPFSLLNNYLVVFSMFIFGDNVIGQRMVSFIFSILNLLITYLLSKKFYSKTIALLATLLLLLSQLETDYIMSARMYMQLQFFSLFYIYAFYKGFMENKMILNG